jgi:hypothetical protein
MRQKARIFVAQFLVDHPCVRCGEADPVVLEFNHLDPTTKSANISDMIHGRVSIGRIRMELAKCEVLCANCHQRHTATTRPTHYKLSFIERCDTPSARSRLAADRRNIRIVLDRLNDSACIDCGVTDTLVLQFDHIHGKVSDIASLVRSGCNTQRVIDEIDKCEVRCANCHRRRTAYDAGWFRAQQLRSPPSYP